MSPIWRVSRMRGRRASRDGEVLGCGEQHASDRRGCGTRAWSWRVNARTGTTWMADRPMVWPGLLSVTSIEQVVDRVGEGEDLLESRRGGRRHRTRAGRPAR